MKTYAGTGMLLFLGSFFFSVVSLVLPFLSSIIPAPKQPLMPNLTR